MPEVKIEIKNIEELKVATKTIKATDETPARKLTQISFLADILPGDVARVLMQDRAGHGLNVAISSPQAVFDLKFEQLNLVSGELKKLNK